MVVGYVESALLFPGGLKIRAKLDSGAKISSLNAQDIKYFSQGDIDWVQFSVTIHKDKTTTLERPVVRIAKVRGHYEIIHERPVIKLGICLDAV